MSTVLSLKKIFPSLDSLFTLAICQSLYDGRVEKVWILFETAVLLWDSLLHRKLIGFPVAKEKVGTWGLEITMTTVTQFLLLKRAISTNKNK